MTRASVAVVVLLAAGRAAAADEWHEAYRAGLSAQGRGDHARAVESLRRAVRLRPEPGRNVITYGTNVEARYFPYLRLADSYLALGRLDGAREALEASAVWKREPGDERERLLARLTSATEQRRAPLPTPPPATSAPPTPSPTVAPTPTPAVATPEPAAASTPSSPPGTALPPPPTPPRSAAPRGTPSPAAPSVIPTVPPEAVPGTLEVVSTPLRASVYVDDEPVGTTDPQTGRLVKSGLRPGPRRVRVSLAGHEDAVREIDVPPGGTATFYASLQASSVQKGMRIEYNVLALLAAVVVVVLAIKAWRRPEDRAASIWSRTPVMPRSGPRSGPPSGGRATPPGQINPGARQDEDGQEWFGDYRLMGLLGRGGMASVFKAERRSEVQALKRPLATFLEDRPFIDRFLREAEIGRTLNHPNIVRILERGEVEAVPYFTMELLPGQTLQALLREQGAMEPRPAASVVVQIAEALDFAHSKGVVHRDLKPSNVMILGDGTTKVMDFGIARAVRFDDLTASGAFLGTPDYVAPEMVEGLGTEPRSDLYTLGIVFYELLTGQRPFAGDVPFAILRKHCMEDPLPPSRIAPGLPPELEKVVLHLLRKRPDDRPASAEELVVTLRDWLHRAA